MHAGHPITYLGMVRSVPRIRLGGAMCVMLSSLTAMPHRTATKIHNNLDPGCDLQVDIAGE